MILNESLWQNFATDYELSEKQELQFRKYYELLQDWNEKMNLTAITNEVDVLDYHFADSLKIAQFCGMSHCSTIADIGTGGGLPGIPLKIKYPDLNVILVEVIQKKVSFLEEVIKELGLTGVQIYSQDWRSFLRHTEFPVECIFSRASLHTDELLRMFKPSSPYKDAQLVYWASIDWCARDNETKFLEREEYYKVGQRLRKYVFFKQK